MLLFCLMLYVRGFAQNKPGTLLWKVSKDNSDNVSYLFGTFHQVNPDFFDSSANAYRGLKESEILFVETYKVEDNASKKDDTNKSLILSWNKNQWLTHLNKKQRLLFERFTKSDYVDESAYEITPQALLFLLQYMYFQGVCDTLNRTSYESMDNRIANIGLKYKLPVVGLDENQLTDIQKSSEQDKGMSLKNVIATDVLFIQYILDRNLKNGLADFLFKYKNLDLNYSLNKKVKTTYLLDGRNNKWIQKLLGQLDQKKCFVAVGISHLFYKNGLIQQLRKNGYNVEPVNMK